MAGDRKTEMKRFSFAIVALIVALTFSIACTSDNPEGPNGGGTGNGGGQKPSGHITVRGVVYCGGVKTLAGVVISDGLKCVQTDKNGCFELDSDLSRTKFIMASIPSGYAASVDENGLPIFYHRVTDDERDANSVEATFEFYPITTNPERYTLIVGADPQPRAKTAGYDRIAYHSLDVCEDFYRDMRESASAISGHNVYGLMLGDIVHENMSLFSNYVAGLKTLGFPMFNVLGNHDNDPTAANDVEGRRSFEERLGPTYYSFNIGKQHYVVLDNLVMRKNASTGRLTEYDQGLTDEIWQWLQNDLQFVDRSTTLMVAAHSPMFMQAHMSDRSASTDNHRSDYATLLSKFAKVHAWAGHTHTTFNYNYPESHALKSIEVHTLARSTGELWTNEYIADGTPRGYTVVEVDGDNISWRFKPTIYQTAAYSGQTSPQPEYKYRDWSYDDSGVAKMNMGGATLSESYQMKVYKPGEYHRNYNDLIGGKSPDNKYVYVDVFLWDDKWEAPKYNGVTMTKVGYKDAYCLADYEMKSHYATHGYKLSSDASYTPSDNDLHTLFRAYETKSSGSGTVTVTDRFGNHYSSKISW